MAQQDHDRVEELFAAALERPADQRASYLGWACARDAPLRKRVEALLAAHEQAKVVLPEPPESTIGCGMDGVSKRDVAGKRFGRYTLKRVIVAGGMGVVYEAEQDSPRRTVALKMMRTYVAASAAARRFEFEVQTLARFQHPNIAQIYDAGVQDDGLESTSYFVMELVPGARTLVAWANRELLDVRARLEMFICVCQAVHHGHLKGVIHRDLKPNNILVSESGVPKIIDFGLARAIDPDMTLGATQTEAGQVLGTVQYMSPEQAAGDVNAIDTRSDVYSLGVVLYELLTGSYPYPVVGPIGEVLQHIAETAPTPPSRIRMKKNEAGSSPRLRKDWGAIDDELETIILRALAKERERRYQSADALARDLMHYLAGEPIEARLDSQWYVLSKMLKRHRVAVGSAAAFVVLLATASIVSTALYFDADRQRQRADRESQTARNEADIAQAVILFLKDDVLAQANPENALDRDVTIREVLRRSAVRIDGRFDEQPLVEASIRTTIGNTLVSLSDYSAAEPHLQRAYKLLENSLGPEHVGTVRSMGNLALLFLKQQRLEKAEDLLRAAVPLSRRILGDRHTQTLSLLNGLANLYYHQERFDLAEPLLAETLRLHRKLLGEDHFRTLTSMNNLAGVYESLRRYDEAEALYTEALSRAAETLPEKHPFKLDVANNLGLLYQQRGRYAKAEPLLRQALAQSRQLLGEEHENTTLSAMALAGLLRRQERYAEAETLYLQAAARFRAHLPQAGLYLGVRLGGYGANLAAEQRYSEAERSLLEAHELLASTGGERHSRTVACAQSLVDLYAAWSAATRDDKYARQAEQWRARIPLEPQTP